MDRIAILVRKPRWIQVARRALQTEVETDGRECFDSSGLGKPLPAFAGLPAFSRVRLVPLETGCSCLQLPHGY